MNVEDFKFGMMVRLSNEAVGHVQGAELDEGTMKVLVKFGDRPQLEAYEAKELTPCDYCRTCGGDGFIHIAGRSRRCGACNDGVVDL